MANILFTWELGEGLGHLQPIQQAALSLLQQGHRVMVVARDLRHADDMFSAGVQLFQAPHLTGIVDTPISPTWSFSQLMHNCGFARAEYLRPLTAAWQSIFRLCQPDIIVFDHSPTALFAASSFEVRKLMSGSGFMCPPVTRPFGVFTRDSLTDTCANSIENCENKLQSVVNAVAKSLDCRQLEHVSEIYSGCHQLLTTVPELDHFGPRNDAIYAGVNRVATGVRPEWPNYPGKRVFCYLKPFECLHSLLKSLAISAQPTIVFGAGMNRVADIDTPAIHFSSQPIDLALVGEQCDFAILNGNHDTCLQLLAAGVPVLNIPLHREQQLFSERAAETGACLSADRDNLDAIVAAMNRLAFEPGFKRQAELFSRSKPLIADTNPLVEAIENLLAN